MLRTFIRTTCTPERADILIRLVDLIERAQYLDLIDGLEAVVAAEGQGTADDVRTVFEQKLGDIVEAIYAAHSITAVYDQNMVAEITQHLKFLLWFNTPDGYTPEMDSEQEVYELGDDPMTILDELYEMSGHNVSSEPVTWVTAVGLVFVKKIVEVVVANARNKDIATVKLVQFDSQEDLKKFAAIYPDSLALKHVLSVGGIICNINELFFTYDEELLKMSAHDLAVEVLGFAIISENPDEVSNATFAKRIVENAAGQGARAMDVVNQLTKVIDRVGLK